MFSWYGIPIMFTVVSHIPNAMAFDFWILIFAPDSFPYWFSMACSFGISLGDVSSNVTSSEYTITADF